MKSRNRLMVVVFPAPFAPSRQYTSPFLTLKLIASRASASLSYRFVRLSAAIITILVSSVRRLKKKTALVTLPESSRKRVVPEMRRAAVLRALIWQSAFQRLDSHYCCRIKQLSSIGPFRWEELYTR